MDVQFVTDMAIRGSPAGDPATAALQPRPVAHETIRQAAEPLPTDPAEVSQAVEGINAFLGSGGSHAQFTLHEGSGRIMVEVVDDTTREVVRTIPARELLDLAAKIGEMVGMLVDKKG